jgi:hypothetical protein
VTACDICSLAAFCALAASVAALSTAFFFLLPSLLVFFRCFTRGISDICSKVAYPIVVA